MNEAKQMRLGPQHSDEWWDKHNPDGNCQHCGGQCDGHDCGTHADGCIFGGFGGGYWMIVEGCPLFHGEETPAKEST